eukprot:6196302-Pleurochrysis_carterae.AAC.2
MGGKQRCSGTWDRTAANAAVLGSTWWCGDTGGAAEAKRRVSRRQGLLSEYAQKNIRFQAQSAQTISEQAGYFNILLSFARSRTLEKEFHTA